ncbi:MAG: hypothetical protein ACHBN1_11505 [Heteroscytonema crispum UTEX LB 1556]
MFTPTRLNRLATTFVGVLGITSLIASPTFAQINSTRSYVTPSGNVINITTPSQIKISRDRLRIDTPSDRVTSSTGFSVKPDGSFTTSGGTTITPNGLIISGDRREIITPTGRIINNTPFTVNSDGSFSVPGGLTITPNGLVISPDGRRVTTSSSQITSGINFTTNSDGSLITPGGVIITPNGTIITPNAEIIAPDRKPNHSR